MRRYLLKHTVQMVLGPSTTEMKDRIDVLDLDKLSKYGQDDLSLLVFAVEEMLPVMEFDYHFLPVVLECL